MNLKINNVQPETNKNALDYKPIVDLFALLLEWEIKDVQEKEQKSKNVSSES